MFEQQTVVGRASWSSIRTVGTVDRRKQRVFPVGLRKSGPDILRTQAHRLVYNVARRATALICSQTLKERALLIDPPVAVESRDQAGRVGESLQGEALVQSPMGSARQGSNANVTRNSAPTLTRLFMESP